MKPVYVLVTINNKGRETTVEGWLFETHTTFVDQEGNKIDDGLGISIQPSLDFVEGGLVLTFLFEDVISIMPTQPITAYSGETIESDAIEVRDGNQILEKITPESNDLGSLW